MNAVAYKKKKVKKKGSTPISKKGKLKKSSSPKSSVRNHFSADNQFGTNYVGLNGFHFSRLPHPNHSTIFTNPNLKANINSNNQKKTEWLPKQFRGSSILKKIESGQYKLSMPGDNYEREADHLADHVMKRPPPTSKLEMVNPNNTLASSSQTSHELIPSPGEPLPTSTRKFFEQRFGQDLSQVRVHKDKSAAKFAQFINARAYTIGNNIIFGASEYSPESNNGKKLLAHELVHVVQQKNKRTPSHLIQRNGITELPPIEIETPLENVGWKKATVIYTFFNFAGHPLTGRLWTQFKGLTSDGGIATSSEFAQIQQGLAIMPNIWLKGQGTIQILAHRSPRGLPLQGVQHYELPEEGPLRIEVHQQSREVEVTATTSEEAAARVGVSGTVGIDYQVVSAETEVSAEQERRRGQSISRKWKIKLPDRGLEVNVVSDGN